MIRGLLRAAWYLLAYQVIGGVLAGVVLTVALGAAAMCVTLVGIPLLIAVAAVIRGCADVERVRARHVLGERVEGGYRAITQGRLLARARRSWTDPAVWHDVAYLGGMFLPLMILGLAVLTLWGTCLAGITLPLWYWAIPHGAQILYIPTVVNWHVHNLPQALLTAACCAVAFLGCSWLVVRTARIHASVARALLRAPQDPLAPARDLLQRPGPLPALQISERLFVPGSRE